jgi:MinD superfamily P-loop ATPase
MKREIKELVVISGKGGTGKTSIVASFAALAGGRAVCADCDVDAADLHLVLNPRTIQNHPFAGRQIASITADKCTACGLCASHCRFGAARPTDTERTAFEVDPLDCEGCGVCLHVCPEQAIKMEDTVEGHWCIGETRFGPLVHARLEPGGENSGKLVTIVRRAARSLAEERNLDLILVDGSPGIGCPVIASVTGATLVLAVTEPTVSGEHDLERVLSLTRHFNIPTAICVNKLDLNPEMAERIEKKANLAGAQVVGRIRYDPAVTLAQMEERTVVETEAPSAQDIQQIWQRLGL